MGQYPISYQRRLLAYLLLGGLLPLLAASAMILYAADRVYENTQAKAGRAEVQRISREIDNLAGNYQRLMMPLLARGETIAFLRGERGDVEHIYGDLYAVLSGRSGEISIYLLSADGTQVIATGDLPRAYRTSAMGAHRSGSTGKGVGPAVCRPLRGGPKGYGIFDGACHSPRG